MPNNTIGTITGAPAGQEYGTPGGGFKTTVPTIRKWEKELLKFLDGGDRLAHTKYLSHKNIGNRLGDVINLRRYFGISADPRQLQLDKNSVTGPALKELHGTAVEMKLEWFGNGIGFNDVVEAIHIDSLMKLAMPRLMRNGLEVMDNIAALALYEGASKIFVKGYDHTKVNSLEFGTAATDVEVAAPLNHDVLRYVTKLMINNVESYVLSDGTTVVPKRAKILPFKGNKYHVLNSEDSMDDLLDDEKFRTNFIRGISAEELRQNKIISTFRYTLETIDNHLTIHGAADAGAGVAAGDISLENAGNLHVTFVIGKEFAGDIKLSGAGTRMFVKQPNTTDSGDLYGRQAFVTYKLAYNVQVFNSKAIYAIVTKPNTYVASGSVVDPATIVPTQ